MTSPVLLEKDTSAHIARITLNRPEKKNALTVRMNELVSEALAECETDDSIKVVLLKGAGGNFSAGQDLNEVYSWYDTPGEDRPRRPSQRRRLAVDRKTFREYNDLLVHNKITIAQVDGVALGGGLEYLLGCDLSVVAEGAQIGMPAARFLGPVLGNLHLFFHRLGPVLAKDLLLTGRIANADEVADQGIFTRFVPAAQLEDEAEQLAAMVAKMPADGIAIAKESYRLIEESMGMALASVFGPFLHAYGTNLRFEDDEFNFVKVRAKEGVAKAFKLRDEYFEGTGGS